MQPYIFRLQLEKPNIRSVSIILSYVLLHLPTNLPFISPSIEPLIHLNLFTSLCPAAGLAVITLRARAVLQLPESQLQAQILCIPVLILLFPGWETLNKLHPLRPIFHLCPCVLFMVVKMPTLKH